jgi:hypothetical protein
MNPNSHFVITFQNRTMLQLYVADHAEEIAKELRRLHFVTFASCGGGRVRNLILLGVNPCYDRDKIEEAVRGIINHYLSSHSINETNHSFEIGDTVMVVTDEDKDKAELVIATGENSTLRVGKIVDYFSNGETTIYIIKRADDNELTAREDRVVLCSPNEQGVVPVADNDCGVGG